MITITRNIPNAILASALVFALTTGSAFAQAANAGKPQAVNLGPMDQNGDGKISAAEAQVVTAKTVAKIDANHDGVITAAEMKAEEERQRDAQRQRELSMLDSNHDGKTSTAEFGAMDTERFNAMDRNHDGQLSPDELRPPGQ